MLMLAQIYTDSTNLWMLTDGRNGSILRGSGTRPLKSHFHSNLSGSEKFISIETPCLAFPCATFDWGLSIVTKLEFKNPIKVNVYSYWFTNVEAINWALPETTPAAEVHVGHPPVDLSYFLGVHPIPNVSTPCSHVPDPNSGGDPKWQEAIPAFSLSQRIFSKINHSKYE